jgi:hypothetical protein
MQGAKAGELLGAAYASERTKYVLYNPVFVATGLHEPFGQPLRALVRVASAVFAQPVAKAVPPIAALIDRPPAEPLTAWKKGKIIDLAVDRNEARRFEEAILPMAQSASSPGPARPPSVPDPARLLIRLLAQLALLRAPGPARPPIKLWRSHMEALKRGFRGKRVRRVR